MWVEYPDIERTAKELGVGPTAVWPDGSPMYTLPIIYDPSTKTAIGESTAIARYLDTTYPDTPRVIPEGTDAFQEATAWAIGTAIGVIGLRLYQPVVLERLDGASKAYFKAARERTFGGVIEEWSPRGSAAREAHWKHLHNAFGQIAGWLDAGSGEERRFFMGDRASFADIVLAGRLLGMKRVFGEDSEDWKTIESWHGGRWVRQIEAFDWL